MYSLLDLLRKFRFRRSTSLAEVLEEVEGKTKAEIFEKLPLKAAVEVFPSLSRPSQEEIAKHVSLQRAVALAEHLESDEAADFLQCLPEKRRKEVLQRISPQRSDVLKKLAAYPPESAGGIMQTEVPKVLSTDTVEKAIERIRRSGRKNLSVVYVVDREGRLLGLVSLRRLLFARPGTKISKIMSRKVLFARVNDDQEEVAKKFKEHRIFSLPVVDEKRRLLGVITADDVIEVVEKEVSEDFLKGSGVKEEDLFEPVSKVWMRRVAWLVVNLGTVFLSATVVSLFTGTIKEAAILASFMPVIAGMGGNAGTQTMAVVIRGMAARDLKPEAVLKVVWKEVRVGFLAGLITGLLSFFLSGFLGANPVVSLVVFLAMLLTVTFATVAGTLIPYLLKRLGFDPASGSGILITTITDVVGYGTFLGLATLALS